MDTENTDIASIGPIKSRSEVVALLGEIETYFKNHEPSSPIPLIVQEMRKLVNRDFRELLQDIDRALNPPSE